MIKQKKLFDHLSLIESKICQQLNKQGISKNMANRYVKENHSKIMSQLNDFNSFVEVLQQSQKQCNFLLITSDDTIKFSTKCPFCQKFQQIIGRNLIVHIILRHSIEYQYQIKFTQNNTLIQIRQTQRHPKLQYQTFSVFRIIDPLQFQSYVIAQLYLTFCKDATQVKEEFQYEDEAELLEVIKQGNYCLGPEYNYRPIRNLDDLQYDDQPSQAFIEYNEMASLQKALPQFNNTPIQEFMKLYNIASLRNNLPMKEFLKQFLNFIRGPQNLLPQSLVCVIDIW
ncbi:hypothetical protein pb186bvf_014381 [Paramecium bursaria]